MPFVTTQRPQNRSHFPTTGLLVYKQAAPGGNPIDDRRFPGDKTNPEAWQRALGIGLTGLGIGAGARSLIGLKDLLFDKLRTRKPPVRPGVVQIAVPETEDEEEAVMRRSPGFKLAGDETRPATIGEQFSNIAGGLGNYIGAPAARLAGGAIDLPFQALGLGRPTQWLGEAFNNGPNQPGLDDLVKGRLNEEHTAKPWFLPTALGLGGAGLYGGYKAVDKVLETKRKQDKEQELEDAKEEYRRALVEQYSPEGVKRGAEQDELGKDLSELYQLHKQASWASATAPVAGPALGLYGALAGILAGGTGLATYEWAKDKSPSERLSKALKDRERLRWATRPPEIYAVAKPVPVRVGVNGNNTHEDDEIKNRVAEAAKIASLYKP